MPERTSGGAPLHLEWSGKMKEWMRKGCKALWSRRVGIAGLALACGCGWAGWLEWDVVAQIVAAIYAAMLAQSR